MNNVIRLYFTYRSLGLRPNHAWRVAMYVIEVKPRGAE